jgi:hypothetical protein
MRTIGTGEPYEDAASADVAAAQAHAGRAVAEPDGPTALPTTDESPSAAAAAKPHTVLVLGAGASLGAREDFDPSPPLGRELAGYLVRWLDINDPATKLRPFIDGFHWPAEGKCPHYAGEELWRTKHLAEVREALAAAAKQEAAPRAVGRRGGGKVPFEALMDEWSKTWTGQNLVEVAQRILTYAMNVGFRCAFPQCADRLDDLVERVAPTVIVTVNYDTLTEEALQRRSLRVFYPRLSGLHDAPPEGPGDAVPVFKLHGSVNWLALHGIAGGANLKIVQRQARRQRSRVVRSGRFSVTQTWNTYAPPNRPSLFHEIEESPNAGETVVAAYSSGKYLFNNPLDVQRHRRACFDKLSSEPIGRVVAIGVRPVSRKDDPVTHRLFALLRGTTAHKVYVSTSSDDRRKLERYGFVTVSGGLAEYLAGSTEARDGRRG